MSMAGVIERPEDSFSTYGVASSTVSGAPLNDEDVPKIIANWHGCQYLMLRMICRNYAYTHGIDRPDADLRWSY